MRIGKQLALAAVALVGATTAEAAVVSSTPTLPLLGEAFTVAGSGNCFPAAGACAVPGTLTFNSVVASPPGPPPFNASGQDIVANATLTGTLTDLAHANPSPLLLTGTIEMEILGRTFGTETGSWQVELLAVDLEGPALGHTLQLGLDPGNTSTGTASITPDGDQFLINSFFDVFIELSLDTPTPLHTTIAAEIALPGPPDVAVGEPATVTLLAAALAGLGVRRRRIEADAAPGNVSVRG